MLCACVVVISLKTFLSKNISLKEISLSKCLIGASSSRRFSNSYFFPPFHYWYATSCF